MCLNKKLLKVEPTTARAATETTVAATKITILTIIINYTKTGCCTWKQLQIWMSHSDRRKQREGSWLNGALNTWTEFCTKQCLRTLHLCTFSNPIMVCWPKTSQHPARMRLHIEITLSPLWGASSIVSLVWSAYWHPRYQKIFGQIIRHTVVS